MRLTLADWCVLAITLLLALAIILVTAHAISVLSGIEKRQQQGELFHQKLMEQATQSLKDHERAWQDHQALRHALGQ